MKKFMVTITETLVYEVEIEASTAEEAKEKAEAEWNAGEYLHVRYSYGGIDCSVRS